MLLILLGLLIVGGVVVLKLINGDLNALARQQVDTDVLARAKLVLLTKALSDGSDYARPGSFAIPDYLSGNTPATSTANGQYDGKSTEGGCQDSTKPNGLPRLGVNTGGANPVPRPEIRCFGRFPVKDLGFDVSLNIDFGNTENQHDPLGEVPWHAVAANLIDITCYAKLNAETLAAPVMPAACSDTNPVHPWLTVHDETGKIISDKVAAVILLPGVKLVNQLRTKFPALGTAVQYLEGKMVSDSAGCASMPGTLAAPCLISNSGLTNHFIQGKATDTFNDRLVYITVAELSEQLQKRVANEMRFALTDYVALPLNNGKYPWLIPISGGASPRATSGTTQGLMPHMAAEELTPAEFTWSIASGGTETTPVCVRAAVGTFIRNPLRNTFQLPLADPLISFRSGSSGTSGNCTWKNGALRDAFKPTATIKLNCETTSTVTLSAVTTYPTLLACTSAVASSGSASFSILRTVKVVVSTDAPTGSQCAPANFSAVITAANGSDVVRLRGACTSGTLDDMITVSDKYPTLVAPAVLTSKDVGVNFEIANIRLNPVMPTWFGENGWHTHSFAFYSAVDAPVNVVEPCGTGVSVGALINQKAALVIAGAPIGTQATVRPSSILADYFEGVQSTGVGCTFSAANTPHTATYNDTVQAIPP